MGNERICRCMTSFTIDSIGVADEARVGDGFVGEGRRDMRSSISKCTVEEHIDKMRNRDQAR